MTSTWQPKVGRTVNYYPSGQRGRPKRCVITNVDSATVLDLRLCPHDTDKATAGAQLITFLNVPKETIPRTTPRQTNVWNRTGA